MAPRNRLLSALPPDDLVRLTPHLAEVELERGQVLFDAGDVPDHVHFPHDTVVSLLAIMQEGGMADAATVGAEGAVAISAGLGSYRARQRAYVQVPGTASRIAAARLRSEVGRSEALHQLIDRYREAFLGQVLQSVACNALHPVEARFCRWLLMAQDRFQGDHLPVTHEILAEMLGVQRTTVTLAAKALQAANLIDYRRGRVDILSRPGLEETSCECYGVIRRNYEELLPRTYG